MDGFDWSSIPWWGWVLAAAVVAVVVPIKLRVWKALLAKKDKGAEATEE